MNTQKFVLNSLTDKQIEARDKLVNFLRHRLEIITSAKIDKLITNLLKGEAEPADEIRWEWTIVIKDEELDTINKLARTMRGEDDE